MALRKQRGAALGRWLAASRRHGRRLGRTAPGLLLDVVFPPRCVACDQEMPLAEDRIQLCGTCRDSLAHSPGATCSRCAADISAAIRPDACPYCHKRPLHFDAAVTLGPYRGLLRELVLASKHEHAEATTAALAQLLWQRHAEQLTAWAPDVVSAVPMHWRRRLVRRTSGPELIAVELARCLGKPAAPSLLKRRRNTPPQFSLPPGQRFENLRGALRLGRGYHLRSAHVLLVDDVLTSGATCSEAAKLLKRHGAARVWVAMIARAAAP